MELDPRLTFERFVVGPPNRLAAAAARRVADAPGAAYNPLYVYGASGLGKTHLLMAIGNAALRANTRLGVVYAAIEPLIEELGEPTSGGAMRARLQGARLLLLDDVQALGGRPEIQEDLLAVWDAVITRGGQIVLACDRPPGEIPELDRRLATRFSGGLVADISPPTSEDRVAIITRRAGEGGHRLAAGVPEALAHAVFGNVREVHGALNRIIAVQEVEQRLVGPDEIHALLGGERSRRSQEFTSFVSEIEGAVDELVVRHSPEQRLAEAILRYEGEGYRTTRLEAHLRRVSTPEQADELIRAFTADVQRLENATAAIRGLDAEAPELARVDVLLDPDRVREAEALVERVRERTPGASPRPKSGHAAAGTNGRARGGRARPDARDPWFLAPDKVLLAWPYVDDWIVGEPD